MPINVQLIGQPSSSGRGVGFYHQFLSDWLSAHKDVAVVSREPDLVHYTYFDLFYSTLPISKPKPTIVTIHDVTPLVLPNLYPKGIKGSVALWRQKLALKNVAAVITDSQNSRKDIHHYLQVPKSKIFITPLAVDPIFAKSVTATKLAEVRARYKLPSEFVLVVAGGPNPNKNLPALAQATADLHIHLVIVGAGVAQDLPPGRLHPELKDLRALKKFTHLITPGFVSSPDLAAIYKLASVYCQPSLYEGFGLPLLEAMTAGSLVVSSNTSSLPEIYPDQTISFNPNRPGKLLHALEKALNLRDRQKQAYIRAAQHRASDFSWRQTAQATYQVYQQIVPHV